ncbi:hypothetical protein BU26DRAFT_29896 [Trematosphaeria pertusa]|uniref:Secreted protein n=1 Tax=Trematosphaeria pertusa TaxID=390896 RepID=A0A6A6J5Q2_9PLEO|nr:uncharacterized protein BU26DRAFT_29896 [Trematosphaeria pertusa]KAF2256813.1 hypothetical protein BU26DRAFT_29896 [Trematosphaeria pertusa]
MHIVLRIVAANLVFLAQARACCSCECTANEGERRAASWKREAEGKRNMPMPMNGYKQLQSPQEGTAVLSLTVTVRPIGIGPVLVRCARSGLAQTILVKRRTASASGLSNFFLARCALEHHATMLA